MFEHLLQGKQDELLHRLPLLRLGASDTAQVLELWQEREGLVPTRDPLKKNVLAIKPACETATLQSWLLTKIYMLEFNH